MELAWPGPRRAHNSVAAAKVPHRRSPDALLPQVESKSGMSYFMPYYIATKRAKVDSAKKKRKVKVITKTKINKFNTFAKMSQDNVQK